MSRNARRLLITTESHETVRVFADSGRARPMLCPICATVRDAVSFDEAAAIIGRGALWLAAMIGDERLHKFEDNDRRLWLCQDSLLTLIPHLTAPVETETEVESR